MTMPTTYEFLLEELTEEVLTNDISDDGDGVYLTEDDIANMTDDELAQNADYKNFDDFIIHYADSKKITLADLIKG